MMRVENIADIYNSNGEIRIKTVDLRRVINGIWLLVNSSGCEFSFTADETNLTGNQKYSTMVENKIKWMTVDEFRPLNMGGYLIDLNDSIVAKDPI